MRSEAPERLDRPLEVIYAELNRERILLGWSWEKIAKAAGVPRAFKSLDFERVSVRELNLLVAWLDSRPSNTDAIGSGTA